MTDAQHVVLQFESVEYRAPNESFASFGGGAFELEQGGLTLVRINHESEHVPIADLATGLLMPTSGRVRFENREWQTLSAFEQSAARGRIGCVLEKPNWISSLSVKQNVMLSERHHTQRTDAEIAEEAEMLCEMVGLRGLPIGRPDHIRSRELRMLEWVRAFMGNPVLVILMFPERQAFSSAYAALAKLVDRARLSGTAILWVSDQDNVWLQANQEGMSTFQIKDERWMTLNGEDS